MKIRMLISACALCLCSPGGAFALEVAPAVKVTPLVRSTSSWNGAPVRYPQGQAEITGMIIEIAAGAQPRWHGHPVPSFAVVLVGTLHNGRSIGAQPVKLVVFYAGAVGTALTYRPADGNR